LKKHLTLCILASLREIIEREGALITGKNMLKKFIHYVSPPDFGDEEKNRIAEILTVITLSIMTGFLILAFQRILANQYSLVIETVIAIHLIALSIIFLKKGYLQLAETTLLWTLLGYITYLLYSSNGLHNIILLAIPVCLVFAAVALKTKYFIVYTIITILAVITVGSLEILGKIRSPYSNQTDFINIIDIVVILTVTAVSVRILADNFLRSIHKAKASEKEIRQRAEKLQESEEKFRTLTEELPNMVYIYKDKKIIYINERCYDLIGYTRDEMYSADFEFLSIVAPEHQEIVKENFNRCLSGENVEPYECTLISKENKQVSCLNMTRMIHYEGEPSVLGLLIDLTDFKRAQEEIKESQSRLYSIITSAKEAIITIDSKHRILSFNPAAELMFDCSEEEAIGQSIDRFIIPEQESNEHKIVEISSKPKSILSLLESNMERINGIRVSGEIFPVEASIAKVSGAKEELYTIVLRDITERIKAEETQRNLQAQLFHSQKMEAIGTLAGGIAHDFNNILSVIIGNAELVKLEIPPNNRAKKHIEEVLNASERAQELVQRILSFSRKQEAHFRPIRLHYILREAVKLIRASIPTTIEIKLELPENGPLVMADPTQIHQILMNLCTNSAHAMETTGGKLTIRQRIVEFDDRAMLYHPDLKKGKYTVFSVQDTGIGMDGFTLRRIFEPFFTTKGPGKGTGLGLTIVHAIVKNHGGAIKVQSQPGKGTQVDVYLPIYEGEEEQTRKEELKEISGGNESIMIVDDEPQLVETFTSILEELGYKISAFTDPIKALKAFEENPESFDLIIADQTMPHMKGTALASKILQIAPTLPIILMTGYDQLDDTEQLESLGIKSLLLKPFKKSVLAETIRKVLKKT